MAGLIEADQTLAEGFDFRPLKNEAIPGGFVGNPFVFVHFEEGCGAFEVASFGFAALGLDLAEFLDGLVELARETVGVQEVSMSSWTSWC